MNHGEQLTLEAERESLADALHGAQALAAELARYRRHGSQHKWIQDPQRGERRVGRQRDAALAVDGEIRRFGHAVIPTSTQRIISRPRWPTDQPGCPVAIR